VRAASRERRSEQDAPSTFLLDPMMPPRTLSALCDCVGGRAPSSCRAPTASPTSPSAARLNSLPSDPRRPRLRPLSLCPSGCGCDPPAAPPSSPSGSCATHDLRRSTASCTLMSSTVPRTRRLPPRALPASGAEMRSSWIDERARRGALLGATAARDEGEGEGAAEVLALEAVREERRTRERKKDEVELRRRTEASRGAGSTAAAALARGGARGPGSCGPVCRALSSVESTAHSSPPRSSSSPSRAGEWAANGSSLLGSSDRVARLMGEGRSAGLGGGGRASAELESVGGRGGEGEVDGDGGERYGLRGRE